MTSKSIAAPAARSCRAALALKINAVGAKQIEDAPPPMSPMSAGCSAAARNGIQPQHLERIALAGKRHLEFQHRTRHAHGGIAPARV
jgi:hypothetical protein